MTVLMQWPMVSDENLKEVFCNKSVKTMLRPTDVNGGPSCYSFRCQKMKSRPHQVNVDQLAQIGINIISLIIPLPYHQNTKGGK